jgi:SAM-dependent methyltransferase
MTESLPDHVRRNRLAWDRLAAEYEESGRRGWADEVPTWGIWQIREAELRLLPDVAGRDVIELGCGTAYWSAWLARRGARVVGIDNSERQLETARALQREHRLDFPLIHGNAEAVPLPDASFDLALSEYGASIWCDPDRWIPEAARLLRAGGRLVFLCNSTLSILCSPDDGPVEERLLRPQFGIWRFEWPEGGVNYHLAHGDWIRVLRGAGFVVEALHELQAPADAVDPGYHDFVRADWARRWPTEDVWAARKAG